MERDRTVIEIGSMVASALERAGITAWGVVMGPQGVNLDQVREIGTPSSFEGWNRRGVFFNHILVQFEYKGEIWRHDVGHTMQRFEEQYTAEKHRLMPSRLSVHEL